MNKFYGLVLVPLGLAGAIWMPCAGPQAGQRAGASDSATFQLELGNAELVRQSRADVARCLETLRGEETPRHAMELYEALLVSEGLEMHRERALESFGPHNLPDSSAGARVHYLLGSDRAGLPVVPVRRDAEPDYWGLVAVLEGSSDPWFEFDLGQVYGRLLRRAEKVMGKGKLSEG